MASNPNHKERGFIIIALNSEGVDYVKMAALLAESLHLTQTYPVYVSVVTNEKTYAESFKVFDRTYFAFSLNPASFLNESKIFHISPYAETIKLEADMLVTSDLHSWWDYLDKFECWFPHGARDHTGQFGTDRSQRKFFDQLGLPDIYSAISYFKKTKLAEQFFKSMNELQQAWVKFGNLANGYKYLPTDEAIAMTCLQMDIEPFVKDSSGPSFIHLKPSFSRVPDIRGLPISIVRPTEVYIGTTRAMWPIHYYDKTLPEINGWYRQYGI